MQNTITESQTDLQYFIEKLSSASPVPGGGGASALIGAIGVSLCSMVANLTSGKEKYAPYQEDIEKILIRTADSIRNLLDYIQRDADVFEPLSAAYHIPKDQPDRDIILENALISACSVPMKILKEVYAVSDIMLQLYSKGSRLALSDVGVAASACRCAMEGAVMNIYINTKLMKNRTFASETNLEAETLLKNGTLLCDELYHKISYELRCS